MDKGHGHGPKYQPRTGHTREPDPKHLEQKHRTTRETATNAASIVKLDKSQLYNQGRSGWGCRLHSSAPQPLHSHHRSSVSRSPCASTFLLFIFEVMNMRCGCVSFADCSRARHPRCLNLFVRSRWSGMYGYGKLFFSCHDLNVTPPLSYMLTRSPHSYM